ncbi:WhiB family transcriptional regulator [Microbacterium oxydans]|uniref:WhiB family transcriptional regulator n=1 Tax=Microbacterium oxydans TaxID=82380 RepID=UPI003AFA7DBC
MSADDAWEDLKAVLEHCAPPCSGHDVFLSADLTELERAVCTAICAGCPIRDLCNHYAVAARVDSGFWAGVDRASRRRARPCTSTPDAEAASSAPITNRRNPS